jgi:flavoprotein
LSEAVGIVESLRGSAAVDVFLSRAASEVLPMYGLSDRLSGCAASVTAESGRSFPSISGLAAGRYGALIIAPATGSTVAKCAHGIADSLVSCMFAQGGKSRVPICVLPTDVSPDMTSIAPSGAVIKVYPRKIDLELSRKIGEMDGVTSVLSPDALRSWIDGLVRRSEDSCHAAG